jgi:hypothetical protein
MVVVLLLMARVSVLSLIVTVAMASIKSITMV